MTETPIPIRITAMMLPHKNFLERHFIGRGITFRCGEPTRMNERPSGVSSNGHFVLFLRNSIDSCSLKVQHASCAKPFWIHVQYSKMFHWIRVERAQNSPRARFQRVASAPLLQNICLQRLTKGSSLPYLERILWAMLWRETATGTATTPNSE